MGAAPVTEVYLMVDTNADRATMIKVGISRDVERRLRQHRTACPGISIYASWRCPSRQDARRLERDVLEMARSMPGVTVKMEWICGAPPSLLADSIESEFIF